MIRITLDEVTGHLDGLDIMKDATMFRQAWKVGPTVCLLQRWVALVGAHEMDIEETELGRQLGVRPGVLHKAFDRMASFHLGRWEQGRDHLIVYRFTPQYIDNNQGEA